MEKILKQKFRELYMTTQIFQGAVGMNPFAPD